MEVDFLDDSSNLKPTTLNEHLELGRINLATSFEIGLHSVAGEGGGGVKVPSTPLRPTISP